MTAELNPFLQPHWHGFPMRPLCPWKHAAHRDYYALVDNSEKAFHKVTQEMEHVDTLVEDGRLVLVTGDSGCGETALLHRCVDSATWWKLPTTRSPARHTNCSGRRRWPRPRR